MGAAGLGQEERRERDFPFTCRLAHTHSQTPLTSSSSLWEVGRLSYSPRGSAASSSSHLCPAIWPLCEGPWGCSIWIFLHLLSVIQITSYHKLHHYCSLNSITLLNPSKGPVAGRPGFCIPCNPWPIAPLYFSISDFVMKLTRLWKHTDSPAGRSELSPYTLQMAALCPSGQGVYRLVVCQKVGPGKKYKLDLELGLELLGQSYCTPSIRGKGGHRL